MTATGLRLTPTGHLLVDHAVSPDPTGRPRSEPAALAELAPELAALLPDEPGLFAFRLATRYPDAHYADSLAHIRALGALYAAQLRAVPELASLSAPPSLAAPAAELLAWVESAPPMPGGEYLDLAFARALFEDVDRAVAEDVRAYFVATAKGPAKASPSTLGDYLEARAPALHAVGRVHFHLAENAADPKKPFAFLATYVPRLGDDAKARHRPLGQALRDHASDSAGLLRLLSPVARATATSPLIARWYEAGLLYQPRALSVEEAHDFLRAVPACEAAGIVVRAPDWWKSRPRVRVTASVGDTAQPGIGLETLLSFEVGLAVDGEPLTRAEMAAILEGGEGLVRLKGRWVEVDRTRLEALLGEWKRIARAAKEGLTLREAMRLVAGVSGPAENEADAVDEQSREWAHVRPGEFLRRALADLEDLRDPAHAATLLPPASLRATLRPYQLVGLRWLLTLERLGLGGCLADDMGLGKTLQVIALLLAVRERRAAHPGRSRPHLLVVPASLLGNWQSELARFGPDLRVLVEHSSATGAAPRSAPGIAARASKRKSTASDAAPDAAPSDYGGIDLVITTYGQLAARPSLAATAFDIAILDEAQAIRNPGTKQSRAARGIDARIRIALTGTPVENRLSDLWALFDYCAPGLLGNATAFGSYAKRVARSTPPDYAPLRRLVRPYILRRLKTDPRVAPDLPAKTELRVECGLSQRQGALYQAAVDELAQSLREAKAGSDPMKRRGLVLATLLRLKQICNHPAHWLGESGWPEAESGKLLRLREIAETIAERGDKVLVFTQFREATAPLDAFLGGLFGRPGLVLHGGTPVALRQSMVERFQRDDTVGYFVLSLKAGGTGLNLTAAQHVVHFDRWWNPAVEDQATDRAFRIGQKRNVLVHKLVCRGTVEERIDALVSGKRALANDLVEGSGEAVLTEMSDSELLATVSLDLGRAVASS